LRQLPRPQPQAQQQLLPLWLLLPLALPLLLLLLLPQPQAQQQPLLQQPLQALPLLQRARNVLQQGLLPRASPLAQRHLLWCKRGRPADLQQLTPQRQPCSGLLYS
jgi:hypothetical protein